MKSGGTMEPGLRVWDLGERAFLPPHLPGLCPRFSAALHLRREGVMLGRRKPILLSPFTFYGEAGSLGRDGVRCLCLVVLWAVVVVAASILVACWHIW